MEKDKRKLKIAGFVGIIIILLSLGHYLHQRSFGYYVTVDAEDVLGSHNTIQHIYKYKDSYYIIDNHQKIYKSKLTTDYKFLLKDSGIKVKMHLPKYFQLENGNIVFHNIENNKLVFEIFNPTKNEIIKSFNSVNDYNSFPDIYVVGNDILFAGYALNERAYTFEKYSDAQNKITLVKRNNLCGMDNFIKLDNGKVMFFDIKKDRDFPQISKIKTTQLVSYILDLNTGEFTQHKQIDTGFQTLEEGFFGTDKQLVKINENQLILFEFSEKTKTNYISLFEIKNQELNQIYTITDTRIKYNLGRSAIIKLNDDKLLINGGAAGFNSDWFWYVKKSYLYDLNKRELKRIADSKYAYLRSSQQLKIASNQVLIYNISFRNNKDKLEIEIYIGGKYGK